MPFEWFGSRHDYESYLAPRRALIVTVDPWIGNKQSFDGYCTACRGMRTFTVFGGALFGAAPNLREGMVCTACCMSNRQRLMLAAAEATWLRPDAKLLMLERLSALYPAMAGRYAHLLASEYGGPTAGPGETFVRRGERIRHEDITRLSFADGTLDGVMHSDLLEHVPRYKNALREAFRALRPGGVLLMTCPFFATRDAHLVRARVEDGKVVHLEPPEIHGDPLSEGGILAYYHFGWPLLDEMREQGFDPVEIGVWYDPLLGFPASNYPDDYGLMLPIVFRARKSA